MDFQKATRRLKNSVMPFRRDDKQQWGYVRDKFAQHGFKVERLPPEKQRTQVNTGTRVMFYRPGCDVCPIWERALSKVNMKLPRGKQISYVDITSKAPEIDWLEPDGTPEVYIDGMVIKGATTDEGQLGWLRGWLEDELQLQV